MTLGYCFKDLHLWPGPAVITFTMGSCTVQGFDLSRLLRICFRKKKEVVFTGASHIGSIVSGATPTEVLSPPFCLLSSLSWVSVHCVFLQFFEERLPLCAIGLSGVITRDPINWKVGIPGVPSHSRKGSSLSVGGATSTCGVSGVCCNSWVHRTTPN